VPGVVLLVAAFILFGLSAGGGAKGNLPYVALGFIVLTAAVILLAPFCLAILGRLGRHAPIGMRLALRDLARYRARSGSALAAISIGVMIAVIISVARSVPPPRSSRCGPGCPRSPACSSPTATTSFPMATAATAPPGGTFPCPKRDCLANPVIQEVSGLPAGTSAPNTVITLHAIHRLGLRAITSGWLIQTPNPPTAAQISSARLAAAAAGMSVETKSSVPTSAEIINWATVFGIVLALAILAMSVGLIRSETASDLRTLTATGASSPTRRNLTAVTAGALAFTGAVLGTVAGYVAASGWFRTNSFNGGVAALITSIPGRNLLIILVGMPLAAAACGWLLAGREPPGVAHQPIE